MREVVKALVDISVALSTAQPAARLEAALRTAADAATSLQIEEALLQSYLFLGYPAALRGLTAWRRVSDVAAPAAATDDRDEWQARGIEMCERVYGGQYDRLRGNVAALHPDIERWMVEEGYGKVLGRPGLELDLRELCVIALLAPQDAAPQLYSHLRGALNAGAETDEVDAVVRRLRGALDTARGRALDEQWSAVRSRGAERDRKD